MVNRECSFCGTKESNDTRLIAGDDVFICEHCVISAYKIFFGDIPETTAALSHDEAFNQELLVPKELKKVLDDFVIGQDQAKKIFSVGVYNHYKRIFKQSTIQDDTEISKSNILLMDRPEAVKRLWRKRWRAF